MEDGHIISSQKALTNRNSEIDINIMSSNAFMNDYRKILPKEYRKGLIPAKKRKFLIDKDKRLCSETLMRPNKKSSANNFFYIPEDKGTANLDAYICDKEKLQKRNEEKKLKFDKGYSVDSAYSLDRGFGYIKVGKRVHNNHNHHFHGKGQTFHNDKENTNERKPVVKRNLNKISDYRNTGSLKNWEQMIKDNS